MPTLRQKIVRRLKWLAARPGISSYLLVRNVYYGFRRKLISEPVLRAYCTSRGRGVKTGIFPPFILGQGEIHLGDEVTLFGRLTVAFASSYDWTPVLEVGDRTSLGHETTITVARSVRIGRDCMIATGVIMADTNSHPVDPVDRLAGLPAPPGAVRPVEIGDNVWVGARAILLPGTTIGEGSIVAAGAVVRGPIPAYTVVAGNPALPVKTLAPPASSGTPDPPPGNPNAA